MRTGQTCARRWSGLMATWAQKVTIKYPAVYLLGRGARADILSVALAGAGQAQDAGGKVIHVAPDTTSTITSKSISKDGGHATRRRLLKVAKGAINAKSLCAATPCLLDVQSRSNTYPSIEIDEEHDDIGHEATVSRLSDEQVFYLRSRRLSEDGGQGAHRQRFLRPVHQELPMENAVELNRLITLQMEGSIWLMLDGGVSRDPPAGGGRTTPIFGASCASYSSTKDHAAAHAARTHCCIHV